MYPLAMEDILALRATIVDFDHCRNCVESSKALGVLGVPSGRLPAEADRELRDWYDESTPPYFSPRPVEHLRGLLDRGHSLRIPGWSFLWVRWVSAIVRTPAERLDLLHSVMFLRDDRVLSRAMLRLAVSLTSPSERGYQLGKALFYMNRSDCEQALTVISSLRSESACYQAVRMGFFGLGQAHPDLVPQLIRIAKGIENPSLRARALLACVPYVPSSPGELELVAQVLAAAEASPDPQLQVFCNLRLRGATEEGLGQLRSVEDPSFQLDAWSYLIASERHGLSPRVVEFTGEYLSTCSRLPHKKAIGGIMNLRSHLGPYDAPNSVHSMVVGGLADRLSSIEDCLIRRQCTMLAIGFLHA